MNTQQRAKLHDLMKLLLDHESLVDYPTHDIRGHLDAATFALSEQQMRARLHMGGHLMMDCSQGVTCLYKWAGLRDPNGLAYKYAGYTGTLLRNLTHYTHAKSAGVGALVVYGPATGDHVSCVYESGGDPLLWSHGFEGGPVLIRLSAQKVMHRPPVTFLNVSGIGAL